MNVFHEIVSDVWRVFSMGVEDLDNGEVFALTPGELCAKLTGMRRVVSIMWYCDMLSDVESEIIRNLISDCRAYIREHEIFWED